MGNDEGFIFTCYQKQATIGDHEGKTFKANQREKMLVNVVFYIG